MAERLLESVCEMDIPATDTPIELVISTNGDFPIFPVFLRQGDTRMLSNVEMQVQEIGSGQAKLIFNLPCFETNESLQLNVNQFYSQDGMIKVGLYGVIAYRGLDEDGRGVFSMAMVPAIDVHSRNYQKQSPPNLAKVS